MGKFVRIAGKVLLWAAGVLAVIVVALQLVLNSRLVGNIVDKTAAGIIDGSLNYSGIHFSLIRRFPRICVSIDSLSVTYPHDRYSAFDGVGVPSRLLGAGRAPEADTLVRLDRFSAEVNVWRILGGTLRLGEARISGLGLYAHAYNDTTANWGIFRSSGEEEPVDSTEVSEPSDLPWISVGGIAIDGTPHIVYTSQQDTVMAAMRLGSIRFGGDVKAGLKSGSIKFRRLNFSIDSLLLFGRLPADTLAFALDSLHVRDRRHQILDIGLGARAMAMTGAFGRVNLPANLRATVGVDKNPDALDIDIRHLDANLAYIPLHAEGALSLREGATDMDVKASIDNCPLGEILAEYGSRITETLAGVHSDARLNFNVEAVGRLSENSFPNVRLGLGVPDAAVSYDPMTIEGRLGIDLRATMDSLRCIDADLRDVHLSIGGAALNLSGNCRDLLGKKGSVKLEADGYAVADSLLRFLPDSLSLGASGRVNLSVKADAPLAELETFIFDKARIGGRIYSESLKATLDTLDASLFGPEIRLGCGRKGIILTIGTDSLFFRNGEVMRARVRGMKNMASVTKVEKRGKTVPRISVHNSTTSAFVRMGDSKFRLRDLRVGASLQKRVHASSDRRRQFRDSLRRAHPGVARDSLFAASNVKVSLDSSLMAYLRDWDPSGFISIRRGGVTMPSLPLRTRLDGLSAGFNMKTFRMDSLKITCGTSDLRMQGELNGVRKAIIGRGMLNANLDITSHRLNVNELLAALDAGKSVTTDESEGEKEESFVRDSIAVDGSKPEMGLIVLPGNVTARARLKADRVDYSDIVISPFVTGMRLQQRTLQLTNTSIASNLGFISLDAFYSTKRRDDISLGVGLDMRDISAAGIIHMLPAVDDMMPALKSFEGLLGCEVTATAQLDTNMNVIMPSLDGVLKISGKNLNISDAGDLRKITGLLLFKDRNIGHIDDLSVSGIVHDGKIDIYPFELGVDRYRFALRGTQKLDKTMDYHISVMKMPVILFPFGVNIYGTTDKWKFSLGSAKYKEGRVPVYSGQIDTMQVNIVQSIRDIFRKGVDSARKAGKESLAQLENSREKNGDDGKNTFQPMSYEEFCQLDEMHFSMHEEEMRKETDDAVEAALSEVPIIIAEDTETVSGNRKRRK